MSLIGTCNYFRWCRYDWIFIIQLLRFSILHRNSKKCKFHRWIKFRLCPSLSTINVDSENDYYRSIEGVLYDKNLTNLIRCPGGKMGTIIIPEGVSTILEYSFNHCSNLISVVISDTVTSIKPEAFSYCTSLHSVTISDNATYIGYSAFQGCTSLTSVIIPAKVTSMGTLVFYECTSLLSIDVNENNQYFASIDGVMFDKALTELIQYPGGRVGPYSIPDGVTSIGAMAFGAARP